MLESLGKTRRQDRVLHGIEKAIHVVLAFVLLPVWLIGQRLAGVLRRRLDRADPSPSLPVPEPREQSMGALMADLEAIPNRLHPNQWAVLRKAIPDLASFVLTQHRDAATLGYSYPGVFFGEPFEGADGERIAATIGLQDEPGRPGLIVVHGVFSTRRFEYVRDVVIRAYYDWGFNVAAMDMRMFGLTNLTSKAPTTVGWKEGEDLICLARRMKELGATTVGALGFSLGGSTVLNAACTAGADKALDGGILSNCGVTAPRTSAERLSKRVKPGHPAYPINYGFHAMLTSRARAVGMSAAAMGGLAGGLETFSPDYYGVSADEIWGRAAAANKIGDAKVPVLHVHAEDDTVIKVDQARLLEAELARNPNDLVRVWIQPGGGHCAFDYVDADWTWAVYRTFFERWARYGSSDGDGKVVYSPAESGRERTAAIPTSSS
jgi:predicted alpha/beta-fold hydrolase